MGDELELFQLGGAGEDDPRQRLTVDRTGSSDHWPPSEDVGLLAFEGFMTKDICVRHLPSNFLKKAGYERLAAADPSGDDEYITKTGHRLKLV